MILATPSPRRDSSCAEFENPERTLQFLNNHNSNFNLNT